MSSNYENLEIVIEAIETVLDERGKSGNHRPYCVQCNWSPELLDIRIERNEKLKLSLKILASLQSVERVNRILPVGASQNRDWTVCHTRHERPSN
jgi:hypothetical protein